MTEPDSSRRWQKVARAIIPLPQRSILAIMAFLGVVFAYGMRICLSITIISIVEPKNQTSINIISACPIVAEYRTYSTDATDPIYKWDEKLIGHILSSFYIGYVVTHIPGGLLCDFWGGKHLLNGSVLLTSLFTLITPLSIIYGGPYCLIAVRVLIGAAQGVLFPAINVLLAAWIPRNERSFYGAMVYGASQIGTVFGTAVSGVLLYHHSWSMVYYVFGVIGLIWTIFFSLMCSSGPQNHSYISDKEKAMLLDKIGIIHRTTRLRDDPWAKIFVNIPLLALIVANCGHDFGFFAMVSYLPKYLSDVLHYDIKTNGFLSALPFISMYIVSIITGFLADVIIDHKCLSLTNCRKFFAILSAFLPALGMILASFAACNRTLVIIAFTVGMAMMGFFYSSLRVNALDLSPNFAGTVMAYVNGTGAIMGIIAPIIVGMLTAESTVLEYRRVFWIVFILLNGTCIFYVFFGSGEVQPFNEHTRKSATSE